VERILDQIIGMQANLGHLHMRYLEGVKLKWIRQNLI